MLTVSELGSIEKGLDALGLPSGSYRDGYRDAMKAMFECFKSESFIDLMVKECCQMFAEAVKSKEAGGVMDIFNKDGMMQKMVEKTLAQQLGGFPLEAKAALEKTRVGVVRKPDRIEIVINPEGDPGVEKVRDVFLDSLLPPLVRIITLFGCQASVETAADK